MSKKAPDWVLFCGADLTFTTLQIDFSDAALVFRLPIISMPEINPSFEVDQAESIYGFGETAINGIITR